MSPTANPRPPPTARLAVVPELLADVLGRIIADRGLAVIPPTANSVQPYGSRQLPAPPREAAVTVVCGQAAIDTDAAVVLWLPEGDLEVWETVTEVVVAGPQGRETVEVADLDGLVDLIVELATTPEPGSQSP